jgi:uncharacterized membrane protein
LEERNMPMKKMVSLSTVLTLVLLGGCSDSDTPVAKNSGHVKTVGGEATILHSWQGDYPVARLNELPEGQREHGIGYIADAKTFENVWKAFQPGEAVPEVDFKDNLVLFARNTQFFNRIRIGTVNVTKGEAEVLAMETMSAMPIEDKVAMSLAVVARKGIESIRTPDGPLVISDQSTPQTYVYECSDGYGFTARIEEGRAWLFLPNQTVNLPPVHSGSVAEYREGSIMFRIKGDKASLEVGETRHMDCTNNRAKAIWEDAKLRGVDFRARGNEPGWHMEITAGKKILFVGDYGSSKYAFDTPEPLTDEQERTTAYRVQDARHDLSILIQGRPCQDTMSGESFDVTVTVILDGKEYRGCGKALH